jgi:aryl-alcohol dehydrogenase-like predicted oxidoreductase
VAEAQTIAHFRGWSPVIALQLEYSLLERTVEGELIPMAQSMGIGIMPWSPLKNGFLSGKYTRDSGGLIDSGRRAWVGQRTEADYVVIDALQAVSAEVGASPATVALAWVHSRPGVASTLIGARRLDQLTANLAALDVTLTAEQIATLDAVSKPPLKLSGWLRTNLSDVRFSGHEDRRRSDVTFAYAGREYRALLNCKNEGQLLTCSIRKRQFRFRPISAGRSS